MENSLVLALQLNHEENSEARGSSSFSAVTTAEPQEQPGTSGTATTSQPQDDIKSLDSQELAEGDQGGGFDSISESKVSIISDKTSKCNFYVGDSRPSATVGSLTASAVPECSVAVTDSKSMKSIDSLGGSQTFDSISACRENLISDKTSKCNFYVGDSPVPSRSALTRAADQVARSVAEGAQKKDSISSSRGNLSYSIWDGAGSVDHASLSDVSSLCNLICMETGRSGVMSQSHSPDNSGKRPGSPAASTSDNATRSISRRVYVLLLDSLKVRGMRLQVKTASLPELKQK
eukprot:sb/3467602/